MDRAKRYPSGRIVQHRLRGPFFYQLLQLGWKVEDTSPKALADRIKSDTALYGALITAKGYKLD